MHQAPSPRLLKQVRQLRVAAIGEHDGSKVCLHRHQPAVIAQHAECLAKNDSG
jgi:hypothetical protein